MTTTDPAAVPDEFPAVPDVCDQCGWTYGPNPQGAIYRSWLKVHARPHGLGGPLDAPS